MPSSEPDGPGPERTELPADLLALVYDNLREMARAYMAGERRGHTLQPTALVHEAWQRLGPNGAPCTKSEFLAQVATRMRHILVDHARAKQTAKRGGGVHKVSIEDIDELGSTATHQIDLLALDEALTRLAERFPEHAPIVEARYFGGMNQAQIADAFAIGLTKVQKYLRFANAWLRRELGSENLPGSP